MITLTIVQFIEIGIAVDIIFKFLDTHICGESEE